MEILQKMYGVIKKPIEKYSKIGIMRKLPPNPHNTEKLEIPRSSFLHDWHGVNWYPNYFGWFSLSILLKDTKEYDTKDTKEYVKEFPGKKSVFNYTVQ